MESSIIKVGGMSCQGCVRNITGVLTALPGVVAAEVSLSLARPGFPSIPRWSHA